MTSPDLSRADWRTSTRSGGNGNCVEVARNLPGITAVRDSKDPSGPVLTFANADWDAFTAQVRDGALDLRTTFADKIWSLPLVEPQRSPPVRGGTTRA